MLALAALGTCGGVREEPDPGSGHSGCGDHAAVMMERHPVHRALGLGPPEDRFVRRRGRGRSSGGRGGPAEGLQG